MQFQSITGALTVLLALTLACAGLRAAEVHTAAQTGNLDRIQQLLKENPKLVNLRNFQGWTPLAKAAYNGNTNLIEFLLANGADLNIRNSDGETPRRFFNSYLQTVLGCCLASH